MHAFEKGWRGVWSDGLTVHKDGEDHGEGQHAGCYAEGTHGAGETGRDTDVTRFNAGHEREGVGWREDGEPYADDDLHHHGIVDAAVAVESHGEEEAEGTDGHAHDGHTVGRIAVSETPTKRRKEHLRDGLDDQHDASFGG